MNCWICATCGTQFAPHESPPSLCPICTDSRQYIGQGGQKWTTIEEMVREGYRNSFRGYEDRIIGIGTAPSFAIGQRALLLRSKHGNILWDCITYLDDVTVDLIKGLGGIRVIAISHPHYYSSMVTWADRFSAEIYLHEDDREWVQRPSERIHFWSGSQFPLDEDATLIRLGGHFAGAQVLHWAAGAEGRGALLSGDTLQVVSDQRYVSFMYSYPNLIPLPVSRILAIKDAVQWLTFDRLYGAWFDKAIEQDAKQAVISSADRYIAALSREGGDS